MSLDGTPIVRATQVHGNRAVTIRERPEPGAARDAGECDVLATDLAGVALAVQTADCVPIVLAGSRAVATAHAGWRGTAANAAGAAVRALEALGDAPDGLRAWIGPSVGACCYEVGGEVAAQFAGEFLRASCGGRFRLDVAAVNRAQLEAAGVPAGSISTHPACTICGGAKYASYRRDGARAGRMIGTVPMLAAPTVRAGCLRAACRIRVARHELLLAGPVEVDGQASVVARAFLRQDDAVAVARVAHAPAAAKGPGLRIRLEVLRSRARGPRSKSVGRNDRAARAIPRSSSDPAATPRRSGTGERYWTRPYTSRRSASVSVSSSLARVIPT